MPEHLPETILAASIDCPDVTEWHRIDSTRRYRCHCCGVVRVFEDLIPEATQSPYRAEEDHDGPEAHCYPPMPQKGPSRLSEAQVWTDGYAAGHGDAVKRMSGNPEAPASTNPYAD